MRYEVPRPAQLVCLAIKQLGRIGQVGYRITGWRKGAARTRGIGWQYVHVAIDDGTRLA